MSQQLYQAVQHILKMPYYKNEHARSGNANYGHEEAVADRIKAAGFTEVKKSSYPKVTKALLKNWASSLDDTALRLATSEMPVGTYILQPAGSQGFPDVLVKDFNDRFVPIECKSSQDTTPMWNDNVPKPETIYVLSSGNLNKTTVFMGRDVISAEEEALLAEQQEAVDCVVKIYVERMRAVDRFNRGWVQKSRKQHFQQGGGDFTNYFTHRDRSLCEERTLEYANQ